MALACLLSCHTREAGTLSTTSRTSIAGGDPAHGIGDSTGRRPSHPLEIAGNTQRVLLSPFGPHPDIFCAVPLQGTRADLRWFWLTEVIKKSLDPCIERGVAGHEKRRPRFCDQRRCAEPMRALIHRNAGLIAEEHFHSDHGWRCKFDYPGEV